MAPANNFRESVIADIFRWFDQFGTFEIYLIKYI